jgi:hypothetical protein
MLTKSQQATYRPLVEAAWLVHCRLQNISPNNKPARDAWYRDQVHSAVGVWSTRDADPDEDFQPLVDRFRILSGDVQPLVIRGWTPPQISRFQDLAERAWSAESDRGRVDHGTDFRTWLTGLLDECGVHAHAAADKTESYDAVMAALAVIAGDEYWINRTAQAAELRMRHVIRGLMSELTELTGCTIDWEYCRGIYRQMALPLTMEEATAVWLWKVLQALDTYRRRLSDGRQDDLADEPVPF